MPSPPDLPELDVHMGYKICDLAHGGGWVGTMKFGRPLAQRGVNWTIWCSETDPAEMDEFEGVSIRRLTAAPIPSEPGGDHPAIKAAIEAAKRSHEQGRAGLVVPGTWGWGSLRMMWKARLNGIKFARDSQIMPDPLPLAWWPRLKAKWGNRLLLSPVTSYFALSHELKRAYKERYTLLKNQVHITPNGVDLQRFRPASPAEKSALRASLGLPIAGPLVLFCGSIIHRKGVDLLLRAWSAVQRKHPDAVLVLRGSLGQRPSFQSDSMVNDLDQFTEQMMRLQRELPNPQAVIFAGHGPDVESYYRSADLFVFPSRLEGLPYVLSEAMSCALPCIVSPFVGIPLDGEELGKSGTHFRRCSHEPESIAAEVNNALDHPAQTLEMGRQARLWMEKTQGLDHVADIWATAYRKAAGL